MWAGTTSGLYPDHIHNTTSNPIADYIPVSLFMCEMYYPSVFASLLREMGLSMNRGVSTQGESLSNNSTTSRTALFSKKIEIELPWVGFEPTILCFLDRYPLRYVPRQLSRQGSKVQKSAIQYMAERKNKHSVMAQKTPSLYVRMSTYMYVYVCHCWYTACACICTYVTECACTYVTVCTLNAWCPVVFRRDCEQLAKFTAFKESAKCVPLGPDHLPSVCCYTLLNTYQE